MKVLVDKATGKVFKELGDNPSVSMVRPTKANIKTDSGHLYGVDMTRFVVLKAGQPSPARLSTPRPPTPDEEKPKRRHRTKTTVLAERPLSQPPGLRPGERVRRARSQESE